MVVLLVSDCPQQTNVDSFIDGPKDQYCGDHITAIPKAQIYIQFLEQKEETFQK